MVVKSFFMDLSLKLAKLHRKQFCDEIEKICKKYENVPEDTSLVSIIEGTVVHAKNLNRKELRKIYFDECESSSSSVSSCGRASSDRSSFNDFSSEFLSSDEENKEDALKNLPAQQHQSNLGFCEKKQKDWDIMSSVSMSHFKSVAKVSQELNSKRFKLDCLESASTSDTEEDSDCIWDTLFDTQSDSSGSAGNEFADHLTFEPSLKGKGNAQLEIMSWSDHLFQLPRLKTSCKQNYSRIPHFFSNSSFSSSSTNSPSSNLSYKKLQENAATFNNLTPYSDSDSSFTDHIDPLSTESCAQQQIFDDFEDSSSKTKVNVDKKHLHLKSPSFLCSPVSSMKLNTSCRSEESEKLLPVQKNLQYMSTQTEKAFQSPNVKSSIGETVFTDKTSNSMKNLSFSGQEGRYPDGLTKIWKNFSLRPISVILKPLDLNHLSVNSKISTSKEQTSFKNLFVRNNECLDDDVLEISP